MGLGGRVSLIYLLSIFSELPSPRKEEVPVSTQDIKIVKIRDQMFNYTSDLLRDIFVCKLMNAPGPKDTIYIPRLSERALHLLS